MVVCIRPSEVRLLLCKRMKDHPRATAHACSRDVGW